MTTSTAYEGISVPAKDLEPVAEEEKPFDAKAYFDEQDITLRNAMPEMTEKEYRRFPAVNKSTLWEIRRSPAHYKWAMEHPGSQPDTPALRFGRAVHSAVLTPEQFAKEYCIAPDVDRRTKDGRAKWQLFLDQIGDMTPLDIEEVREIDEIRKAVLSNRFAAKLLEGIEAEKVHLWKDAATGLNCKCRMDGINVKEGYVLDLKTCADASTSAFTRDALRYGYDVEAAHYLRAAKTHYRKDFDWYFICVEKAKPYAVNVVHAGDDFLDRGMISLLGMMDKLKDCILSDNWPDYGRSELILPEWAVLPDDE